MFFFNFRKAATQSIISRDWDFTKLGIGGLDKVIKLLSSIFFFTVWSHHLEDVCRKELPQTSDKLPHYLLLKQQEFDITSGVTNSVIADSPLL